MTIKKIILDTNFLMIPGEFNVDIISEIERIANFQYTLWIIDKTMDELEKVADTAEKEKDRMAAKLAKQVIKKNKIKLIPTRKDDNRIVDDIIVELVDKHEYIVATQDKGLKHKLKEKDVPLIILRQKRYLKMLG